MSGKNKAKYCQGKEVYQRMNYLYQAGTLMAAKNPVLSCYYGNLVKAIGKKAVLRIEPNIKRTICKRCGIILIIDSTAEIISAEDDASTKLICKICKYDIVYVNNPNHKLWVEQTEAVAETIDFTNNV